ncbi:MAG: GTP-binding protein [Planctomycetia bacterium]
MKNVRFVMVGGFLGAGKTTTLARLARMYAAQGKKVAVVTNDQAADLVDTHSLRSQGLTVAEVSGACFCCRFDDLAGEVRKLEAAERPDVVLAEPVGSCTDLVATVVQPMKDLYGDRLTVAPYAVLFKPSHGLRILRNAEGAGFSAKAAYIFRKQLEEADAILVNRIDELSADEAKELAGHLAREFPGTPVQWVSAKTGAGFDAVVELLAQEGLFGRKILNIDYDVYAAGEAELGWLNSSIRVTARLPFSLDALLLSIVEWLQVKLSGTAAEVAHLKVIGLAEGAFGVANLVSSTTPAETSLKSFAETKEFDLVVNARVATDPAELEILVREVVASECAKVAASAEFLQTQSFRPGRPVPTHRYAEAK